MTSTHPARVTPAGSPTAEPVGELPRAENWSVSSAVIRPSFLYLRVISGKQEGVTESFAEQLVPLIPRLRRYARALTHDETQADDLTQQTLLRAMEKQDHFRANSNLRAWAFAIMHNIYMSDARRSGTVISFSPEDMPEQAAPDALAVKDEMAALKKGLGKLAPEQRTTLMLVALEGFSYAETARVMQVPLGTVMSRLSRARAELREALRDDIAPQQGATSKVIELKQRGVA